MVHEPKKTASDLNSEGIDLLDQGRINQALERFAQAIEVDPNYAPTYLNRAEAFRRQGKEAEANRDEIKYNTLSAAGHFRSPTTRGAGEALIGSKTTEEEEPVKSEAVAPVHAAEEAVPGQEPEKVAKAAFFSESMAPEDSETDKTTVEEESTPVMEMSEKEESYQDQDEELDAGEPKMEEGEEEMEPSPPRHPVEVRPFRFNGGERRIGTWAFNDWGLRDSFTYWTVERFFRTLLLMVGLAVGGILVAKISFCPEDVSGSFWTGCGGEILGFALGGMALGGIVSLLITWGLRR
ncbi:MAG: tetratricopeptide repeat protein [Dehalococcoidia bacterium]